MPSTRQTYPIEFRGGLVTNVSPLQQGINMPGSARILKNFEPSVEGGYRRIEGYTKYDDALIPPYGSPVVTGASQTGTSLNIANIRVTPVAGDTVKLTHATAVVNGATSSTTALVLDGNSGTLVAGMTVTGTGISGTVTIASVTNQNNIVLSDAQTLANDVTLTFTKVYTIAGSGVSFNDTNNTATLTFTTSLLTSPSNGDSVEFVSTVTDFLTLGCGLYRDSVIVAKNDDLYKTAGSGYTLLNVPSYGTVVVNGASQSGTSLAVDGLTGTPQAGDVFKIAADGPTAKVNGATSSTTTLVVDTNVGTIAAGMTVTGTGVADGTTVASLSDQQNLVISSAQSIGNNVDLTFSSVTDKIYTVTSNASVSSGGATLAIAPALASAPADNAVITFLSTSRETATKTRFATYNFDGTEKIAIVDGSNVPATYTETNIFTNLIDAPTDVTAASFVANFKNQLFFAKDNVITFTAPYTDSDFTAANGSGTISVGADVTGLIVFRQQLIIFTDSSIFQLVGNTVADFNLQPITLDIGCIDTGTIQEVGGDVMFLAPDGLRLLSGTERIGDFGLGVVSKNIQKELIDLVSSNSSFASVVVRSKSQYRIFGYNPNTSEENAKGILGTQTAAQGGEGMSWSALQGIQAYVADSKYIESAETIVFANDDGYLYKMESGNSFNGSNIETTFATPYMPISDPRIRKTFYKMFLYTDPQGSVSFDATLKLDFDQNNSVQPSAISLNNTTGAVSIYGNSTFGTATFGSKLQTLFESQLVGSGFVVSLQYTTDSTDPPFSLDAITLEYGTNTRR